MMTPWWLKYTARTKASIYIPSSCHWPHLFSSYKYKTLVAMMTLQILLLLYPGLGGGISHFSHWEVAGWWINFPPRGKISKKQVIFSHTKIWEVTYFFWRWKCVHPKYAKIGNVDTANSLAWHRFRGRSFISLSTLASTITSVWQRWLAFSVSIYATGYGIQDPRPSLDTYYRIISLEWSSDLNNMALELGTQVSERRPPQLCERLQFVLIKYYLKKICFVICIHSNVFELYLIMLFLVWWRIFHIWGPWRSLQSLNFLRECFWATTVSSWSEERQHMDVLIMRKWSGAEIKLRLAHFCVRMIIVQEREISHVWN